MAYTVYLMSFNKRLNSTKRPDITGLTPYNVLLKQNTDVESPVFTLEFQSEGYPKFNYMYIPDMAQYYWITDIVSVRRNHWEIHAQIDVMATYKTEILSTLAYIEYGFNEDASGETLRIRDTRQNVAEVPTVSTAQVEMAPSLFGDGVFILSAVGKNSGVLTYKLTRQQMTALLNTVSTDIHDDIATLVAGTTDATEAIKEILQYFSAESLAQGSCIQAVRSCLWLPFNYDSVPSGIAQQIYLGDYGTGVNAPTLVENAIIYRESELTIPWPESDWKRMNCQGLMYVPFIGTVGIPVQQINGQDKITFTISIEALSGNFCIVVSAGPYPIYAGSGNFGSTYAIGSSNVPASNVLSGFINAVGGAIQAGGGIVAGAASAYQMSGEGFGMAAQNIGEGAGRIATGYLQAFTPVVQCAGTMASNASYGLTRNVLLALLYYKPVDDSGFQARYGHPVFKVATPVAGYCKTSGFSVQASGRATDLIAINNMMDRGVFIE